MRRSGAAAEPGTAIFREFQYDFGTDLRFEETRLKLPANVTSGATAHAVAGIDPFPIHARDAAGVRDSVD